MVVHVLQGKPLKLAGRQRASRQPPTSVRNPSFLASLNAVNAHPDADPMSSLEALIALGGTIVTWGARLINIKRRHA
jgi:hypothetical protein